MYTQYSMHSLSAPTSHVWLTALPAQYQQEYHIQEDNDAGDRPFSLEVMDRSPLSACTGYISVGACMVLHHIQERCIQECRIRGIDIIWGSYAAQLTALRCTVINFQNGPWHAPQRVSPSALPPYFCEDFSPVSSFRRSLPIARTVERFRRKFIKKLQRLSIDPDTPQAAWYARAEMRRWGLYIYPEFRAFLQTLPVYDTYIPEIAAQLIHDHEFVSQVTVACNEIPSYVAQEALWIDYKPLLITAKERWKLHRIRAEACHATIICRNRLEDRTYA